MSATSREIYVKLPTGIWVKITGKIERLIRVRSRKNKQVLSYTLVGETLDEEPVIRGEPVASFYISSSNATKYLIKILDHNIDSPVIIEPYTPEIYTVKTYSKNTYILLSKIAEEMKIIRHPKKKRVSKTSS